MEECDSEAEREGRDMAGRGETQEAFPGCRVTPVVGAYCWVMVWGLLIVSVRGPACWVEGRVC